MENLNCLSRRAVLKGGMVLAGSAAFSRLFGVSEALVKAQEGDDDLQTMLNIATTAKVFATTHYLAAINGDLGFDDDQINHLKAAFLAEQDHLELFLSLGGEPLVKEIYTPENLYGDPEHFLNITEIAETNFTSGYLAAARIFAAAGGAAAACCVTVAQIAAVEAGHRAVARQFSRRLANENSYALYQYQNTSDALPVLDPFLTGEGDGFVGPFPMPTEDDIAAIRSEADMIGYENSARPFFIEPL